MLTSKLSLKEILSQDPELIFIIYRFGIPLDNAEKNIGQLCKDVDIEPQFFLDLLNLYRDSEQFKIESFLNYDFKVILDYLRKTHISFLTKRLPEIELTINNLVGHYSDDSPFLHLLNQFYINYKTNLISHIEEEERFLFPIAEKISKGTVSDEVIAKTLQKFEEEHNHYLETAIIDLCEALGKFESKLTEPSLFRVLKSQLDNFKLDLTIHHLIEESVLIKKMELSMQRVSKPLN